MSSLPSFSTWSLLILGVYLPLSASQTIIQPDELAQGIETERWGAVLDVRTKAEWDTGHIETATLVEALSSTAENAYLIDGCQGLSCEIAVYCRSGNRAGAAIARLQSELGFGNVTLYNALGTSQWTAAGYPLVFDESVVPDCANSSIAVEQLSCFLTTGMEEEDDDSMTNTTFEDDNGIDDVADTTILEKENGQEGGAGSAMQDMAGNDDTSGASVTVIRTGVRLMFVSFLLVWLVSG